MKTFLFVITLLVGVTVLAVLCERALDRAFWPVEKELVIDARAGDYENVPCLPPVAPRVYLFPDGRSEWRRDQRTLV